MSPAKMKLVDDNQLSLNTKSQPLNIITYPIGQDIKFPFTLSPGFSGAEGTHRWTDGNYASMQVPLIDGKHGRLQTISFINTRAFLPADRFQTVTIKLNGVDVGRYDYNGNTPSHTIKVNLPLDCAAPATISFDIPHATAPSH